MFSDLVIGYLFCAGAGAGACVLSAVLGLLVPRERVTAASARSRGRVPEVFHASVLYRRLLAPVFATAAILLAIGILFLLADLGAADRAYLLFVLPTPTFLTVGAFALTLLLLAAALLAAAWANRFARMRWRVVVALHWVAIVLGLVVAAYTGLLLSSMPAVPFWESAWLPVLFVASSLSCGCAVVFACAFASGSSLPFGGVLARVSRVDAALLAVESVALSALLASAAASPYDVARLAVSSLVAGELAVPFFGAVVVLGIALPLVVEGLSLVFRRLAMTLLPFASAVVLVGGFALRYCIVAVGAHPEVWTVLS